jgi:hypothetical protein
MAAAAEHDFWGTLSVVLLGIIGVGALALLISRNATTGSLISATGSAFTNALGMALSPVTGGSGSSTFPIG